VPHISKENEDWSKLQLEAEEARVMKAAQAEVSQKGSEEPKDSLVVVSKQEYSRGITQYNGELTLSNGAGPYGSIILTRWYNNQWHASIQEMGETKGKGEGASEREAMNNAAMAAGYSLSGELPKFADDSDAKAKGQTSTSINRPSLETILSETMGHD
jgi:hypothetical protein